LPIEVAKLSLYGNSYLFIEFEDCLIKTNAQLNEFTAIQEAQVNVFSQSVHTCS
jgi:hypothetical protein